MTKNKFTFKEGKHQYFLNGQRLTGVTTIIGVLGKPQLIKWSANMAVDYIMDNFSKRIFKYPLPTQEEINKFFEEARNAWTRKRDKAGDIGSNVHKAVEEYVKSRIKNEPEPVLSLTEQEYKMFEKFKEWAEENNVKFLLSEQKLYSEKYWYAGTVDLVVEIKGKKYIADIKTAKDIYTDNYIQMAGYHIALEELGKIKDLEGYIVINIPKELKKSGEAKIKVKTLHNTEDFKKAFINCLELYRFINKEKPAYLKNKKAV